MGKIIVWMPTTSQAIYRPSPSSKFWCQLILIDHKKALDRSYWTRDPPRCADSPFMWCESIISELLTDRTPTWIHLTILVSRAALYHQLYDQLDLIDIKNEHWQTTLENTWKINQWTPPRVLVRFSTSLVHSQKTGSVVIVLASHIG